jgi:hypothetical protein
MDTARFVGRGGWVGVLVQRCVTPNMDAVDEQDRQCVAVRVEAEP